MAASNMEVKGIPKLTGVTYPIWKRAMTMALMSENCLDIIEGKEVAPVAPEPLEENANRTQRAEYDRLMDIYGPKALSYSTRFGKAAWMLFQSLTRESEIHVKNMTDPIKLWKELTEKMDSKGNKVLSRSIKRAFHDLRLQEKEPIEEFIQKLRDFQTALEGTAEAIEDDAIVSHILVTLPSIWDTKVSAIEDNPDMTLHELERVLKNFQRKLANREVPENIALAAKGFRGKDRGAHKKDGLANRVRDGRVKNIKDIECYYCLQKGHYQMSCPLRLEKEKRRKEREASRSNAKFEAEDDDEAEEASYFAAG